MLNDLLFRLRALFRRQEVEGELHDELRLHLELEEAKLAASGLSREEARRQARLHLGGLDQVKEEVRSSWSIGLLETLAYDLRYGLRTLWRNPGFCATAVLSLAVAIGATTAIFSVVNAVLLHPLPYPDPGRIAAVLENKPSQKLEWLYVTNNNFLEWRRRATSFESLVAASNCGYRQAAGAAVRLLGGMCVSAEFFPMLRVQPLLGHLWTSEADLTGRDHVALLSYDSWQKDFGGDPNVVGRTISRAADRQPFSIIGVLPPDFRFASEDVKVWAPLAIDRAQPVSRFHILLVFGRLKPGVTYAQAQDEMTRIAAQLETESPATNKGWGITVGTMERFYSNLGNTRTTLLVLFGAVGGLLLIACANVANLLLARATVRHREIAVRSAIGATRRRLFRQLLTESVMLGCLGGALGFVMAWVSLKPILAIAPHIDVFRPDALRIDWRILAFSLGVSLLASVVFGITPALRGAQQGVAAALTEAGRSGHGSLRTTLARHSLVVAEISLAVVLLTGTGLFIRTLRNLQHDRLGYDSSHLMTMPVCCLDAARYASQAQLGAFYQQAFERLRLVPGVTAASATNALPMRLFDGGGSQIVLRGFPPPEPGREYLSDFRFVEPDYFQLMGIPLLRGRLFTQADDGTHEPVAVINERMALRYWPDKDPIGQQFRFVSVGQNVWYKVVGVVANSRDRGLGRDTRNTFYLSNLQIGNDGVRGFSLLVRVRADSPELLNSIRQTMLSVDSELFVGPMTMLDDVLAQSLSPQRFSAALMTTFAGLALALALVGVYGVTSYSVAQRRQEIGVRMALGARPVDVMLMVLRQGARLALAGVALGVVGALATTRLAGQLLFGVSARDPITIGLVCLLLGGVAVLACCIPARRAMRVQPVTALRAD